MSNCWGYVIVYNCGGCSYRLATKDALFITLKATELPKWVKNKMLLLDFMPDGARLPCGSYLVRYELGRDYTIFMEVG